MKKRKWEKLAAVLLAASVVVAGCGKVAGSGDGQPGADAGSGFAQGGVDVEGVVGQAGTDAGNSFDQAGALAGDASKLVDAVEPMAFRGSLAGVLSVADPADAVFSGQLGQWWDGLLEESRRLVTARIPEPGTDEDKGSGGKERGGGEEEPRDEEETEKTRFHAAKDYRELLDALRSGDRFSYGGLNHYFTMDSAAGMDGAMAEPGMPGAVNSEESTGMAGSAGKDYSDTNVQVEGIAEADIVKTDGDYIYILSKKEGTSKVFIVRAEDGALTLESSFSPESSLEGWQEEMYVSGNRLAVVRHGVKRQAVKEEDGYFVDVWFGYYGERQTEVLVYDITDRKAPFLAGSHVQDGDYVSSREKDGWLYVISEKGIFYNYFWPVDRVLIEEDIPEAGVSGDGAVAGLSEEDLARLPLVDGGPIAPEDIYFREDSEDSVYTIVTAICLETPEQPAEGISFVAGSGHCYMSGNAIYLAAYDWYSEQGEFDHTEIVKISYEDGKLALAAQGKVKGSLDDQFSMDEKDGYLRVVTTVDQYKPMQEADSVWRRYLGRSNALYVLDAGMEVVGSLEGLAEDERIYSARFIGDTAYFVTFRNTDPLFSVDVSDPAHPVLLGALKIPGFSDYLHPYGEDLLLGIGYDADASGAVGCVKLTMFEISDPLAVTEKHTLVLDGYGSSEACQNHRAVLVDEGKGLIGLPFEGLYDGGAGYQDYAEEKGYAVYGYDEENGFYKKFEKGYVRKWDWKYYYDVPEEIVVEPVNESWKEMEEKSSEPLVQGDWNDWYNMRLRGIYIGDYFYLVNQIEEVLSYRMGQDGFSETARIKLK